MTRVRPSSGVGPSTRLGPLVILVALISASCSGDISTGPVNSSTTTGPTTTSAPPTTPPSTSTTSSTTTTVVEIAPPDGLRPLVAGHNDPWADRINLVLAPWGWDDLAEFEAIAVMFLGWDQRAQLFDSDGRPTSESGFSAELGLFGWEPFRSNQHLFNVWITDIEPPGPALWLNNTEPTPFDVPDLSVVTLALDPWDEVPGITSVAGQDVAFSNQQMPQREGNDSMANAMVAVPSVFPATVMRDLPHELGHALFGLADEYVGRIGGDGVPRLQSYWPSCAIDQATAEEWWGDLVGQVDPMPALWLDEMLAAGFPPAEDELAFWEASVRIDYIDGGCHGDPGSVRAADDTMMGFNAPGFGLVNLRHAEAILELWEGK